MWTRAELKMRAKANIRRYYLAAFIVSLIVTLLGGNSSGGKASAGVNAGTNSSYEISIQDDQLDVEFAPWVEEVLGETAEEILDAFQYGSPLFGVLVSILLVTAVVGFVISVFVAPVLKVGKNRFYMESRLTGESAGVSKVFWGFTHNYLNIVWVMFVKGLIVTLGTMCCAIPGIYFAYCYYMVPYILAENPDISATEALRMSKEMMDGHKINTCILEFSFFGWWFLAAFTCVACSAFITPYYDATFAELYAVLRQKFNYQLNGFGYPDYGPGGYNGPNYEDESRYADYGYGQNQATGGWADATQSNQNADAQNVPPTPQEDRGGAVKRSEGGPGRGYYLNGVFHPYTEDELNELDKNK